MLWFRLGTPEDMLFRLWEAFHFDPGIVDDFATYLALVKFYQDRKALQEEFGI